MTPPSAIIFITGHPGSGKTTLGRQVSTDFGLPFITRDAFKELIFDSLGWSDREWSKKVGMASYRIIEYLAKEHMKAGQPLIIESNFDPKFANKMYQTWQAKYRFKSLQILCGAADDILLERFAQRARTGERHAGHVDETNLEEYEEVLEGGKLAAIDIEGDIIEFDTSDLDNLNTRAVKSAVWKLLASNTQLRPD